MSDLINDGMTKVSWVPSIANINAPAATELTAGNDWTLRITPDGLKTDPTTASVDTGSLGSTTDTATVGRVGYDIEVTFKRGTTTQENQPYTTLKYGVAGNVVVRRGVATTTAYAAGQIVEVYPVVCGEPMRIPPAANEVMKFTSPMKLTSAAATDVTVV
jgi:hypothetical protein